MISSSRLPAAAARQLSLALFSPAEFLRYDMPYAFRRSALSAFAELASH